MNPTKIIAAAISAVICLNASAIAAVADELSVITTKSESLTYIIDSGECGAELRWWLDSEGTLTISGNDTMTSSPWRSNYTTQIENVVIDKDVMGICSYAFSGLSELNSVKFNGNSVSAIGDGAFSGCSSLTEFEIPDSVMSIGQFAFSGAGCYENIDGVYYIGEWAVGFDEGITSVELSYNTKKIAEKAFYNGRSITSLTLSSSLKEIPSGAFYGTGITSISIPDSVETIGDAAFKFCISLEDVDFASGLTSIGSDAFSNCNRIEEITIPDTVKSIGSKAFYDCTSLETITIKGKNCTISGDSFSFSSSSSVPERKMYAYENTDASRIGRGDSSYEFHSFGGNGVYNGSEWEFSADGQLLIHGNGSFCLPYSDSSWYPFRNEVKELDLAGEFTSISESVLSEFINLESITLPDTLQNISADTFRNCSSLRDIYFYGEDTVIPPDAGIIPDGTVIHAVSGSIAEEYAINNSFSYEQLENEVEYGPLTVRYPSSGVLVISGKGKMQQKDYYYDYPWRNDDYKKRVYEVIIEDGITTIGKKAFEDFTHLKKVTIPDSVTVVDDYGFYRCSGLETINLPDTLTNLNLGAFCGCSSLKQIVLPAGITEIKGSVFFGCTSLAELPMNDNITSIGENSFYNCTALTEITLPKDINTIPAHAFENCKSLKKCTFKGNIESIGANGFSSCTSLDSFPFRSELHNIGYNAFSGSGLIKLIIPDSSAGEIVVGDGAFSNCLNLRSAVIGNGVTKLNSTFQGCTSLETVILPDSLDTINSLFFRCSSLRSVDLGSGLKTIGYSNFEGCDSLTELTIPDSCESISSNAFEGWKSLEKIVIPDNINYIFSRAFTDCISLKEVVLPESLKVMDTEDMFKGCSQLTGVILPSGVEAVKRSTFDGCDSLRYVLFRDSDTEIASSFYAIPPSAYIMGRTGSTAEKYAKKYNREFIPIDNGYTLPDSYTGDTFEGQYEAGDCTDRLKWRLDSDGTLTITGSGAIPEYGDDGYNDYQNRPWGAYVQDIKHIIIDKGVTVIGNNAFTWLYNLRTVTILNPDCEIHHFEKSIYSVDYCERNTICNMVGYGDGYSCILYGGIIRGYAGSTAEAYADLCNVGFEEIDGDVPSITTVSSTTRATETTTTTTGTTTTTTETTITSTTTTAPAVEEPALGDSNGDGIINAVDASGILVLYANLNSGEIEVTEQDMAVCDVNKDSMLNAVDASLVLAYYADLALKPELTLEVFLEVRK